MAYVNKEGDIQDPISMVCISDSTEHSTSSVTTCYKKMISYLQQDYPIEHVHISSDGCASQGEKT